MNNSPHRKKTKLKEEWGRCWKDGGRERVGEEKRCCPLVASPRFVWHPRAPTRSCGIFNFILDSWKKNTSMTGFSPKFFFFFNRMLPSFFLPVLTVALQPAWTRLPRASHDLWVWSSWLPPPWWLSHWEKPNSKERRRTGPVGQGGGRGRGAWLTLQQANFLSCRQRGITFLKCKFLLFEPSGAREGDRTASCLMGSDSEDSRT